MLIAMSFNVYLVGAILAGTILGYFLLNPFLLQKHGSPSISLSVTNAVCEGDECGSLINSQDEQIIVSPVNNCLFANLERNNICCASPIVQHNT